MNQNLFVSTIIRRLVERYGNNLHTDLKHSNINELFVAVLLSPQCTDKQVNVVTGLLFKKFGSFDDYANSELRVLSRYLNGLNYYKTKARHLKKAAKMIMDNFEGEVPQDIKKLIELPGVGRKVANVILNEGFHIDQGIAVDTHCITVSRRLRLSRHKDGNKIEQDLIRKIPKKDWERISNLFIALGRDTCTVRNKECYRCVLKDICPSSDAT